MLLRVETSFQGPMQGRYKEMFRGTLPQVDLLAMRTYDGDEFAINVLWSRYRRDRTILIDRTMKIPMDQRWLRTDKLLCRPIRLSMKPSFVAPCLTLLACILFEVQVVQAIVCLQCSIVRAVV